ncbi:MAG: DUF927 domain-containing protein [Candidatus Acidiferrales bacterium]
MEPQIFPADDLLLLVKTKSDLEAASGFGIQAVCDDKAHGLGKFLFRNVIAVSRQGMKLISLGGSATLAEWKSRGGTKQKFLDLVANAPNWEPPESEGAKIIPFPSRNSVGEDSDNSFKIPNEEELKKQYPHWPYLVQDGRIYFGTVKALDIELTRLSNFTARITEEITRDDGANSASFAFHVEGALDTGHLLPRATVPAAQFNSLAWIYQKWGSKPIVSAGSGNRDKLREAIQSFSNATKHSIYVHAGWQKIDGRSFYLAANGAIGQHGFDETVDVDLDEELSRYRLPQAAEEPQTAMQASLSLLDIAPLTITAPLWAAMFRAPLAAALPPDFTVWLEGQTGKFKSTISALFLSHFGEFDVSHLPGSWKSTANSLEKMAFTLKDAPMVIDDYAPTQVDAGELRDKASSLVRAQGNLAGRGRLRSNLEQQHSFPPRGIIISTGEQHPPGHSLLARMLVIDVAPSAIDRKKLTEAQDRLPSLGHAMAGYLQWLASKMDTVREKLERDFHSARDRATKEGGHLRVPEILAHLDLGLNFGLAYAEEIGSITSSEAAALREKCWKTFLELGRKQTRLLEGERPSERFLVILSVLIGKGRLEVVSSASAAAAQEKQKSTVIGWRKGNLLYLPPDLTFAEVSKFCRTQGEPFPVPRARLYKDLDADCLIEHDRDHLTKVVNVRGHSKRCLALRLHAAETILGMPLPVDD